MWPAQTHLSLCIRVVWSESLHGTLWVAKGPKCLLTDNGPPPVQSKKEKVGGFAERKFYVCFSDHRGSTGFNWRFSFAPVFQCVVWQPRVLQMSQHVVSVVFIFASIYSLSVIYLLPVIIHGWLRRPPHLPNKCVFTTMEAEGEDGPPSPPPPPPPPPPPSNSLLTVRRRYFHCGTFFCCCWLLYSVSLSNVSNALRKHAYSNILKILSPKIENFQIKNSDIFHISAQNIDCGYSLEQPRRGGSNGWPQSMFWSEIRQIMYTHVNPSFTT